jgi:hypothetical protein
MNTKTKVIDVKETPKLNALTMLSGIRDKTAAQAWGEKNHYPVVYFWTKRQRVYADKLQVRVDDAAAKIERASVDLVSMAEGALPTGYATL